MTQKTKIASIARFAKRTRERLLWLKRHPDHALAKSVLLSALFNAEVVIEITKNLQPKKRKRQ